MGRRSKKSLALLGLVTIIALGWASGCASTTDLRPASAGDVSLAVPFSGVEGAEVEAVISGDGMVSPIEAELEVRGGLAQGFIDGVEAGTDRHVVVVAYDSEGEICSCEADIEVAPGLVTPVRGISLDCAGPANSSSDTIASFGYPEP